MAGDREGGGSGGLVPKSATAVTDLRTAQQVRTEM